MRWQDAFPSIPVLYSYSRRHKALHGLKATYISSALPRNILLLCSRTTINDNCKLFEVVPVNACVLSADGGDSVDDCFSNLPYVSIVRDGRNCKLSKPPWLLCEVSEL